jgi:hypothetical protein
MLRYIDSRILSNYFLDEIDELPLIETGYLRFAADKLLSMKCLENTDKLINILLKIVIN